MREQLTIAFAVCVLIIGIPYVGTLIMTGVPDSSDWVDSVAQLDTGKTVSVDVDGQYEVLDVEVYLLGVLPGIKEPDKDIEVWKALAVAERTNLYRQMAGAGNVDEADLTEDYLTEDEIRVLWGERNYIQIMPVVEQAIVDTAGITMQYEGEYIEAYYHSVSAGQTVSAEDLLGRSVPYLVSVESSHDVESKDYMNLMTISKEELWECTIIDCTEYGYVKRVSCNGEELSVQEACLRYQIPSYYFYIEDMGEDENTYRIVSLGVGHGLGLSIYGAGVMSKGGSSYSDILQYYYPGVQIVGMESLRNR
jgi:stage II sporulation protein D